eukprot:jgi/Tetstr1/452482/TSEL_039518.t1
MALRQEPCYRIVSALLVVHSHEIGAKAVHLTVDLDDWDARRDDGNQAAGEKVRAIAERLGGREYLLALFSA